MNTVLKWLAVCIFAVQATGGMWYAHLTCCDEADGQDIACCHDPVRGLDVDEATGIGNESEHSSATDKPSHHHHHDPRTCSICQILLTLSATTSIPPVLPTIAQSARPQAARPPDRPFLNVFLAAIDARGPPACALLNVPIS
jgi:hypothetical protein